MDTTATSREGMPGLAVIGGSKLPGWSGRPWRTRILPLASTTTASGVPSPFRSATRGTSRGAEATVAGSLNRPPPRLNWTATSLGFDSPRTRSSRPSPVRSAVLSAVSDPSPTGGRCVTSWKVPSTLTRRMLTSLVLLVLTASSVRPFPSKSPATTPPGEAGSLSVAATTSEPRPLFVRIVMSLERPSVTASSVRWSP